MKLFVWDFHGVMEKGNEKAVLEVSNAVLEQFGYSQQFTQEEINQLYGEKWYKFFEHLLPQEPPEKHLDLQKACFGYESVREIIREHIEQNDYVSEVLNEIAKRHPQIVISNTHQESLRFFLDSVHLTPYFPDGKAFGATHRENIGINKRSILEEFLQGREFDDIIIISDSAGDAELTCVAGGKFYLYTHPGRAVKQCTAEHTPINDLREILKEI